MQFIGELNRDTITKTLYLILQTVDFVFEHKNLTKANPATIWFPKQSGSFPSHRTVPGMTVVPFLE